MATDFQSTPYDANHPLIDPGNDWRSGNGIGDILTRAVSYGNWAGPDNRMEIENAEYIKQQQAVNPAYNPYDDPAIKDGYAPVDPTDAAAMRHDRGYWEANPEKKNMFGWEGMNLVREADRNLADETYAEFQENGGQYSDKANVCANGLVGFFGSRAMGLDAVDWAGDKAGEAGAGISDFVADMSNWGSLDDVGAGLASGASSAMDWLGETGGEAASGLGMVGERFLDLDAFGKANMMAGFANVAAAGGLHLAESAWDGLSSLWD